MGLDKAELKMLILNDLGCDFEDVKDNMLREMYQQEGAASALRQAAKAILGLSQLVDDDIEKGRYELEEAARLKEYISRAATQCEEMSKSARNQRLVSEGRMQGITHIVDLTKKKVEAEEAKLKALAAALEEAEKTGGEVDMRRRPSGVRPGASVAQQRRAEEQAAQDEAAKAASEIMDHIKAESKSKKKAPRKKRTRKKKAPNNGANP
jgi:hypothetical protein